MLQEQQSRRDLCSEPCGGGSRWRRFPAGYSGPEDLAAAFNCSRCRSTRPISPPQGPGVTGEKKRSYRLTAVVRYERRPMGNHGICAPGRAPRPGAASACGRGTTLGGRAAAAKPPPSPRPDTPTTSFAAAATPRSQAQLDGPAKGASRCLAWGVLPPQPGPACRGRGTASPCGNRTVCQETARRAGCPTISSLSSAFVSLSHLTPR